MSPPNRRAYPNSPLLVIFHVTVCMLVVTVGRGGLVEYVEKADASYGWELVSKREPTDTAPYSLFELKLTSQKWKDIVWKHLVTVIVPKEITVPDTALVLITGGTNGPDGEPIRNASFENRLLPMMAVRLKSVTVILNQIPNEPILDGRMEDAIIAYTFDQYLKTRDGDWPLLFPMVKSAVRAMDAAQEVARKEANIELKEFFVTGASKRGWATWLTAVADRRVIGIAPMVIDNLNMAKQMPHQLASWGKFSEMINDYVDLNLPQRSDDPEVRELLMTVDPYGYLDKLRIPKLMVNGTNDPYWVLDANRFYFDELKGEKFVSYVPNAGHGLGAGAAESIGCFYWMVKNKQPRPRIRWTLKPGLSGATLHLSVDKEPKEVRLWKALSAPDRDFRNEQWSFSILPPGEKGQYAARIESPTEGYAAFYAEFLFGSEIGQDYGLCTTVRIMGRDEAIVPYSSSVGN